MSMKSTNKDNVLESYWYRERDLQHVQGTSLVRDGFSHTWVWADVNGDGFSWRRVQ